MGRIIDSIVRIIPKKEFQGGNDEKFIRWFGRRISTPQNRVIVGVTALMTQPVIDLYNKDVDEDTRKAACARDIGKNIAGTTSGFFVRYGFIKLTEKWSEQGDVGKSKFKKLFTPANANPEMKFAYKQYRNAMGTFLAVLGLLITNFAFDIPVTNFITNEITKRFGGFKHDKSE